MALGVDTAGDAGGAVVRATLRLTGDGSPYPGKPRSRA